MTEEFAKKTYVTPTLEVLGDAESITRGNGMGMGDMGGQGLQDQPS